MRRLSGTPKGASRITRQDFSAVAPDSGGVAQRRSGALQLPVDLLVVHEHAARALAPGNTLIGGAGRDERVPQAVPQLLILDKALYVCVVPGSLARSKHAGPGARCSAPR